MDPVTPDRTKDVRAAGFVVGIGLLTLGLGLYPLTNLPSVYGADAGSISPWWFVVTLVAGSAVVALRSLHAGGSLVVGTLLLLVDLALGGSVAMLLVIWELIHHAALVGSRRMRIGLLVGVGVVAVLAGVGTAIGESDSRVWISTVLQVAGLGVMPIWWATEVRRGHELAEVSAQKARLEAERADAVALAAERERADAVREERTSMARDLHDVISSHLSAIAIHSGAALAVPPDGERDRAALTAVRREAVASLEEMRTMVGLLRSGSDEPWASPAGLDELPALVERTRDAGLALTVDPHVLAPDGSVAVTAPTPVAQSALRIVQEALTNALRHGAGDAHLELERTGGTLSLVVTNELRDPRAADVDLATPSPGIGLLSMRERTEAMGGTFDAGVRDGVWQVRADLPTDPAGTTGVPELPGQAAGDDAVTEATA
ncbi:sensor histidine kinase [Georgenia sp. Z1344]|uniref:sensor histidine kinase n=1 Tax=Georgenia sp. Z1344 TaxID=3416706 RepID=UPI003CF1C897